MVGGRGARESGVRGDIAWSMQYINDEPALCMWRRSNTLGEQMRLGSGKRVFAICLSSLWKYIDHRGNLDVKTATLEAMREVVQMGFSDPGKARGAAQHHRRDGRQAGGSAAHEAASGRLHRHAGT